MRRLRILLVDDQKLVLLGLERILRRMREVWEVVVADSGRNAQQLLQTQPFDVLVTDLNMPGYGGSELLEWTTRQFPATVRIVLSGHQDLSMIRAATRTAHRFLNKPCEPDQLMATISQVLELQALPAGDLDLRKAVAGMGQLPGSPITCHRLKAYLNDSGPQPTALREAVLQDPGLAAKVLQLVNSSFFGVPRAMVNPWEAMQLLDRDKLSGLDPGPAPPEVEARLKPIRENYLRLAREASAIVRAESAPAAVQDLVYTAGLLSASGPMIAAMAFPGQVLEDLEGTPAPGGGVQDLSRQFLNLLGLPVPLLDLVGTFQDPSRVPDGASLALAALHVAAGYLDEPFLARTGFLHRVSAWRHLQVQHQG